MALSRSERAPLVTDAIPPALHRRVAGPRGMLAACLIGAVMLALFASSDTPGWAERLGDTPLDHALRGVAGSWNAAMETLGLTRPHEALRAAMARLLDWQWRADNR
jgi:hypothetical protein